MKTILKTVLILMILTANLFAAYSESNTWLVSKSGNDTNNSGTPTSDPVNLATDSFLTLQAAVNVATNGDTILIWPGTYVGITDPNSKELKIIGQGVDVIIADPNTAFPCSSNSVYENLNFLITGIKIIGKTNVKLIDVNCYGLVDGLFVVSSSNITLKRCQFRSPWDAANLGDNFDFWVEDCLFDCSGTQTANCHAIQSCAGGIYINCIFKASKTDTSASELTGVWIQANNVSCIFDRCKFIVSGGANRTGIVAGIYQNYSSAKTTVINCLFNTSGAGASGGPLDLYNASGTMNENGCLYSTSSGTITHGGSGNAATITAAVPTVAQNASAVVNDPNFVIVKSDSNTAAAAVINSTYGLSAEKTTRDACDAAILAKTNLIPASPASDPCMLAYFATAKTQRDACETAILEAIFDINCTGGAMSVPGGQ